MSKAIFVEGLTKTYNGKTVVDHLNLSVKSGTVRLPGQDLSMSCRALFPMGMKQ